MYDSYIPLRPISSLWVEILAPRLWFQTNFILIFGNIGSTTLVPVRPISSLWLEILAPRLWFQWDKFHPYDWKYWLNDSGSCETNFILIIGNNSSTTLVPVRPISSLYLEILAPQLWSQWDQFHPYIWKYWLHDSGSSETNFIFMIGNVGSRALV